MAKLTLASSVEVTQVPASASSTTLLAPNLSRTGASFYNFSTAVCYVNFGATASSSSFVIRMTSNSYFELPEPIWLETISAIWDSATGNMLVTEYT